MQISMKSSVRYAKKDSEIKQLTFQNATPMILPLCSQNAQSFVPQKEAEDAFHAFFPSTRDLDYKLESVISH